ncbi:MAG: hypothetical protein IIT48_07075 [Lachnospiraceae bacterium]|nr:hypothetical protein [Lachnospiraceae bacterium]
MELKREEVARLIDFIRNKIEGDTEFSSIIQIDNEYEINELVYGITNEYLSSLIETISGCKVEVIGEVEELYKCPCCGYNTLTEEFNPEEGTGYDICPFCGWEDDGTTDIDEYRSINKGSMNDYRKKITAKNITNKWLKNVDYH